MACEAVRSNVQCVSDVAAVSIQAAVDDTNAEKRRRIPLRDSFYSAIERLVEVSRSKRRTCSLDVPELNGRIAAGSIQVDVDAPEHIVHVAVGRTSRRIVRIVKAGRSEPETDAAVIAQAIFNDEIVVG